MIDKEGSYVAYLIIYLFLNVTIVYAWIIVYQA